MSEGIRRFFNIIKGPSAALSATALAAGLIALALELSGARAAAGIGEEGFSALAFSAAFALAAALLYMLRTGSLREGFKANDGNHSVPFILITLFCLIISLSPIKSAHREDFPDDIYALSRSNPYVQQFDAFRKGQLELDLPVSPELAAMDNPYDTDMRHTLGVHYFWDHAYFEGNYYSYFGIAPIICVYYPYFALSGQLPDSVAVCMILALFTVITLSLAFREFLIYFGARPRLPLVLLALISLAFGCGIYAAQCYSDFYHFPVLSSMGFNFAVFFFVLRARRTSSSTAASILIALASLSFVLSVMSRPTAALICAAAAPALISRLITGAPPKWYKLLAMLTPAALVAAAGAAVVLSMNYLRFGSPFDFGAAYQLTVSDISKNTSELRLLPYAIRHYILQAPQKIKTFPYFKPSYLKLDIGRYYYLEHSVGMIFFPSSLGLPLSPMLLKSDKDKPSAERILCVVLGVMIILSVIFVDFCCAGVNMRYLYDFLPLALLLGSTIILRFTGEIRSRPLGALSRAFAVLCFVGTILTALGIIMASPATERLL